MEDKVSYKRKRKQSFLRKAKKYAKRKKSGHGGHGTHIDEDLFKYFCRVLDVWNKGFDSEEDKRLFANNVLVQTRGSEMQLCTSQLISRAIETVIDFASADNISELESALRTDLRIAFVDKFCSHLTQKLILSSAKRVTSDAFDESETFAVVCIKFALNNIEEFTWHTYACHVVRTCLSSLTLLSSQDSFTSEYSKLFYGALIESPAILDISSMELGSGLLQSMLKCLSEINPKLCQKSISALLKRVFCPEFNNTDADSCEDKQNKLEEEKIRVQDTNTVPLLFASQPSARLLECAIECSTGKRYTQIYALLFINRLSVLSLDRSANMSVQALIRAVKDKTEFEGIFDELVENLEDIMKVGHTGVLLSLTTACQNLGTRQGQLLHALMNSMGCIDEESKLSVYLLWPKYRVENKDVVKEVMKDSISLHGSLIIQSLLHFRKPIKMINSLLQMDTDKLVKVFCDPRGSHIADAFFKADYVGEKSREKLFHKVKERLVDLVTSKHGSRSFDALWSGINSKHKKVVGEKLLEKQSVVTGNQYGSIISKKIHLDSLRHNPNAWITSIDKPTDTRKLFSDIIDSKT